MALNAHGLPHKAARIGHSHLQFADCIVAATLVATGCLVAPVPMTKRVRGYSGQPANDRFDLKFLRAGESKREEVRRNLHWADCEIKDERLFWGRWISSGSGLVWGVGAGNSSEAGAERHWLAHNLFVEFDDYGTVSRLQEVPDAEIVSQLNETFVRNNPADVDLSSPIELKAKHRKSREIGDVVLHLALDAMSVETPAVANVTSRFLRKKFSRLQLLGRATWSLLTCTCTSAKGPPRGPTPLSIYALQSCSHLPSMCIRSALQHFHRTLRVSAEACDEAARDKPSRREWIPCAASLRLSACGT